MTDILTPTLIAAVAIAAVLGGGIGIGLMYLVQRSQSGGKSLAELRQQQEDYQKEVEAHFERTASLFKDLTDNYRALYDHMASGAQKLCAGEPSLESLQLDKPTSAEQPARPDPGEPAGERGEPDKPQQTSAPDPDTGREAPAGESADKEAAAKDPGEEQPKPPKG